MIAIQANMMNVATPAALIDAAQRASEVLTAGGVVVAPTETQYGLLARADREVCIQRVCELKQRSVEKPMAMFVSKSNDITRYAESTPFVMKLAARYLPGPLTIVLKALSRVVVPIARNGLVGIRISSSPVIAAIVERVDFPLTATSANLTGGVEVSAIDDVQKLFGGEVDLYLDGGICEGEPSTVVDCTTTPPRVLREGAISAVDVRAMWQEGV